MRRLLLTALLTALPTAALAGNVPLENASFEAAGDVPTGWTIEVGATHGAETPKSVIAIDRKVVRAGAASLRLSGDASTKQWRMLTQSVPVAPGDRLVLRVAARAAGAVREGFQYANGNGLLVFKSATGKRVGFVTTEVTSGDRDWVDLYAHAYAPPGSATVAVGVFMSVTGTVWFDDVRLERTHTAPLDEASRTAAFDALAEHLSRTYPFWALDGKPDPGKLFGRHRAAATGARDEDAFLRAVARMLDELKDVHVGLKDRQGKLLSTPIHGEPVRWHLTPIMAKLDQDTLYRGRNVLAGRIGKGEGAVGYLLIGSFQLDAAGAAEVEKGMDAVADTRALVIDVRINGGGDERIAQKLAGRFTGEPLAYARNAFRDPLAAGLDGFGSRHDRVLAPGPAEKRYAGKIVALGGPGCVSSTEGLLLMMKALPQATVVGRPSRGASANPAAFEILPGLPVSVSRWRSFDLDGDCIENVGVPPDVVVEPEESPSRRDAALEKALELLSR